MTTRVETPGPPAAGVRERSWTLRGRLAIAFGIVGALFVLVVATLVTAVVKSSGYSNDVLYRWQPATTTANKMLADVVSQESGLRGYALTKEDAFLEPYRLYGRARQADEQRLQRLIGADRRLMGLLGELRDATQRWTEEIAAPSVAAIGRGNAQRARLAQSTEAKARFDAIRAAARDLNVALAQKAADVRDQRNVASLTFRTSGIAAILILLGCGLWLRRSLGRWILGPVERLGRQTREVSAGTMQRAIVADGPAELTSLGHDVEAMRLRIATALAEAEAIQDELRVRGQELARSNEDLQQFAYVASHDLSEPLRKVANFCQLLERQYGPQLDDRARQYIWFAVDGAKRMQALITDLLTLSRVGRSSEGFERIDMDKKLDVALANLADRIEAAGARVERLTPLPTVDGDRALLVSLLENLIGNAVKYRRDDVAPVVQVSARFDTIRRQWEFTVTDNGIGIEAKYAERIFAVFQRLHLRDAYGGTGIGLALCRRIVEFHGGRIWLAAVESPDQGERGVEPDADHTAGATFRFTLPEGADRAQPRDR